MELWAITELEEVPNHDVWFKDLPQTEKKPNGLTLWDLMLSRNPSR
jgi:hypothetical protein